MASRDTCIDLTGAARAYARELVAQGEYADLNAAVSGELVRAQMRRRALEKEILARISAPDDEWIEGEADHLTRRFDDKHASHNGKARA